MSTSDTLPRFRGDGDAPADLEADQSITGNTATLGNNSSKTREARTSWLPKVSDRNSPWVILGLSNILVAVVIVAYEPSLLLALVCSLAWLFAELSALPAVVKANARGRLDPGENAYPWTQNWVAALARVPYFYNPETNLPFLVALGGFIALGTGTYTGFVALRIAQGSEFNRMVLMSWLGVMSMAFLQWQGSRQVQGIFFVTLIAVKNLSVLAKISYAIKHRDPRKFSDGKMLAFNLVNALIWLVYTYTIPDYVLMANNVTVILCVLPCLILKIVLSPKLLGRAKASAFDLTIAGGGDNSAQHASDLASYNIDVAANTNSVAALAKIRIDTSVDQPLPGAFSGVEQKDASEATELSSTFPTLSLNEAEYDSGASFSSKGLLREDSPSNALPSDFFDPSPGSDLGEAEDTALSILSDLPLTFPPFAEALNGDAVAGLFPRASSRLQATAALESMSLSTGGNTQPFIFFAKELESEL
jgi:hypothetical protein